MLETKIDVKNTAIVLIDMQNCLIKSNQAPFDAVTKMAESKGLISNAAKVVAAAREVGMPIINVSHVHRQDDADVVPVITDVMLQKLLPDYREIMIEGRPSADVVCELKPMPGDHVIHKRRGNAFYNTDLELMLRSRGINTVILAGVLTDKCIASTVCGARDRDFNTIVLSNCCAAMKPEDDDYILRRFILGRGRVRTADEVISAITEATNAFKVYSR